MMNCTCTIGRPVITVDIPAGEIRLPIEQEAMCDIIYLCARDLYHNGSGQHREKLFAIIRDLQTILD